MENVEMHHAARSYILLVDSFAAARRIAGPLLAVLAPVIGLVLLSTLLATRIDLAPTSVDWPAAEPSLAAPAEEAAVANPLDGLLSGH